MEIAGKMAIRLATQRESDRLPAILAAKEIVIQKAEQDKAQARTLIAQLEDRLAQTAKVIEQVSTDSEAMGRILNAARNDLGKARKRAIEVENRAPTIIRDVAAGVLHIVRSDESDAFLAARSNGTAEQFAAPIKH